MREIKFRVWHTPKEYPHIKEMHYFDLKSFNSDDGSQWIDTMVNGKERILYYTEMIKCPKMQFTGLKDKNGKEVYEGGILGKVLVVVEWDEKDARFLAGGISGQYFDDFEAIGNIYENPELLKGK